MPLRIQPARAVALFAVLTILAVSLSVLTLLWGLRASALRLDNARTDTLTRLLAQQTAQVLERSDATLRSVQDRLASSFVGRLELDSLPVHLLLAAHVHGLDETGSLFVVDAKGTVMNSTSAFPTPAVSVADRDYFLAFAKDGAHGLFIGAPLSSRVNGAWTVHLARALRQPDGSLRGVLVAALPTRDLEARFGYILHDFGRPAALYLSDGRLLASLPRRDDQLARPAPELRDRLPRWAGGLLHVDVVDDDGGDHGNTLMRVPGFGVVVGVGDNLRGTLAAWRSVAVPIAGGAMVVCAFLGIAALLLVHELQRELGLNRALREADDRWRRTIDSVMDAMVSVDERHDIIMFNPAAERMFGIEAASAIGKPLSLLLPQGLQLAHADHMRRFAESGVASREMAPHLEVFGRRADGSEFPVESAISKAEIGGAVQFTAVLRDVTERRRREVELQHMNLELRRLSNAQQTVREEERARISRELHDDLGQQLTGINLDLSRLIARAREGRQPTAQTFDSMRKLLDAAIRAVRRISTELRPRMLDDLGFGEAVAWQAGEFARRSSIAVELDLAAAAQVRDGAMATALFRIVQESLTNVARHAQATRVRIGLSHEEGRLRLCVLDNGRGLDPSRGGAGVGLLSMRERVTALGGELHIGAAAGGGTRIEVTLTLPSQSSGGSQA